MTRNWPKVIYSLWLQGPDNQPDLVRLCFRRWTSLNPDYELRVLDSVDASNLLSGFPISAGAISPQVLSDIVRARLLAENGGIWVDATVLPVKPLDAWIPEMLNSSGFFAFERPGPDRALSSWFLAARPAHVLMAGWWTQVERYWARGRKFATYDGSLTPPDPEAEVAPGGAGEDRYPYFWFHYLFGYLLRTDRSFASVWNGVAKLPADEACRLQDAFDLPRPPCLDQITQAARRAPVQKLDWRRNYPLDVLAGL